MASFKGRAPGASSSKRGKMLFFGKWGSGKTHLALQFPRPFYTDTEGGAEREQYQALLAKSGGWYLGPEDGGSDPSTILEQVRLLATTKHDYRTLIVDSVSKVTDTLHAREQERLGDKDQYGASKKPSIAWSRQLVLACDRLDMTVILVAHEVAEWSAEGGGERREVGKMGDVAWSKIPHELNLSLRCVRAGKGIRRAFIDKSRISGMVDGEWFDLQRNGVDVGYAEFVKRFGEETLEAKATPVEFASEEQLAEIVRLQGIVNLPPKEIERWFNAAKVERWEDLTSEQADKAIAAFKAKVEKQARS